MNKSTEIGRCRQDTARFCAPPHGGPSCGSRPARWRRLSGASPGISARSLWSVFSLVQFHRYSEKSRNHLVTPDLRIQWAFPVSASIFLRKRMVARCIQGALDAGAEYLAFLMPRCMTSSMKYSHAGAQTVGRASSARIGPKSSMNALSAVISR